MLPLVPAPPLPALGDLPSPPDRATSGLAAVVLLRLGLKPVVRELHDPGEVSEARERWEARGLATAAGAPVREDADTRAMVSEADGEHTIRPLARHPVVERTVALGGPLARRLLLDPASPVYRWLCQRYGADQAPLEEVRPAAGGARVRQVVYVSADRALAEQARDLDRMGADLAGGADSVALGELLGYPRCCVDAFCALERRWPNRLPIAAAASRTRRFASRLNNLALDRFAWIAHFPCRYDCAASLGLADAAADALAAEAPELVASVDRLLALPRLYRGDDRQAVLLGARRTGAGRLRWDRLVPLERAWPAPGLGGDDPGERAWADLVEADAVRLTRDGPVFLAAGRQLRTGDPPLVLPFGLDADAGSEGGA